jgi:glyoxylase-like metal-dependent hydrolase (beta-lactamase superfamily II)/ferredoxin
MAHLSRRLSDNAAGDFFVDSSCIDCDICRQVAPETFRAQTAQTVVYRQPSTPDSLHRALMALVACPTGSIGTARKHPLKAAIAAFPEEIADGVYFCGFASRHSYGATSYFVVRPGGNVLVDSPRFSQPLAQRLEELGGVRWMVLTHRDDVADHELFQQRFGCQRVMHGADASDGLREVEKIVSGNEPVYIDDDLTILPVPGHTRGHVCLLYQDRFLFTGDHLAWDEDEGMLTAFHDYCWYSWPEQVRSMEKLLQYRFEWVLPGHGRRYHAPSGEEMQKELRACIRWMRKQL